MDANGCPPNKELCFDGEVRPEVKEKSDALLREAEAKLDERIREIEATGRIQFGPMKGVAVKRAAIATYEDEERERLESVTMDNVVGAFTSFLYTYEDFRTKHHLSPTIDNVHEILASMTDKLGRICRYVKHQERNDPKPDWPEGMTTEMVGLLIYMIMLKNFYKVNVSEGMKGELQKSVEQHGAKNVEEIVEEHIRESAEKEASIIKMVSLMLKDAVSCGAKALTFVGAEDKFSVIFTRDDETFRTETIPVRLRDDIINRLLMIGGLYLHKRNTDKQLGNFGVNIDGVDYEWLVESHPTDKFGPMVVVSINGEGKED